jgi:hypothetical protein
VSITKYSFKSIDSDVIDNNLINIYSFFSEYRLTGCNIDSRQYLFTFGVGVWENNPLEPFYVSFLLRISSSNARHHGVTSYSWDSPASWQRSFHDGAMSNWIYQIEVLSKREIFTKKCP